MPHRSLSTTDLAAPLRLLRDANEAFARRYPGAPAGRQPVHTVYVAAHRFRSGAAAAHGREALEALGRWAPTAEALARVLGMGAGVPAEELYARVVEKLGREPVEDLRIDFEDGFGARTDDEEDRAALAAADEVGRGMEAGALPPMVGLRLKSLAEDTRERCVRTLDLFLTALVERTGGALPDGLVLTLPKVTVPEQVAFFAAVLGRLEGRMGLAEGGLRFETMVEVPQAVVAADGACPLPRWVDAAHGRMTGVHLGVYDYTASLGISEAHRGIRHPACDFARHAMQVALAGTGVRLSDGSTARLPVGGEEAVHRAWRRHFDDVTHSLRHGFHQGWDLHPAQLATRYAAVFAFYLAERDRAAERLRAVLARGSDDPHAADALLAFFRRGIACGAFDEDRVASATGAAPEVLRE